MGSTKQAVNLPRQDSTDLDSNGAWEDCENQPRMDGDPHLHALASITLTVSFRLSIPYTHGPHRC